MSSSLLNPSIPLLFSSERNITSKPPSTRFAPSTKQIGRCYSNSVKAMADHWQKISKNQPQPKKKVAQVAPPGQWDRFPTARTVQQMMETMERIMRDPSAYSSNWPSQPRREKDGYSRGRTPWEIKGGDDEYKMRFNMPGMTKNDVKVWIEENMLVVKAEKMPKKKNSDGQENGNGEEEEEEWPAKSYGRYNSRIELPENVEVKKIKAEVKDGSCI